MDVPQHIVLEEDSIAKRELHSGNISHMALGLIDICILFLV
jgi:hypothetical protein